MGGVTAGIRKKYLGLKKIGIGVDYLFLIDRGGKEIFKDLDIVLHHPRDAGEIEAIIRKNNYDFISSIDCPEVHGLLSSLRERCKVLCEIRAPNPSFRAYIKEGNLPSGVRCIIAPSETFANIVRGELTDACRDIPIHVIPNPIEDTFLQGIGKQDVQSPKKYVGWVGRLNYMKNYKEVFKIAEKITGMREDIEFMIVGRFPSGNDNRLSDDVVNFKGRVNFKWLPVVEYQKMHRFYGLLRESGGCFLATSRWESFSNAVLESMASRCPVVASDIDVFKERLEGGRSGAIYQLGDVESAVDAIIKISDDPDFRSAVVNNAYSKVKENFTMGKVSLRWKELFESL